ncbi:bacterial alpha-L-rhamnosidase domain protein [Diplocarpon rosae]|nr:bacterial alpha-L-rhamnosidase domain protein [Diplocarpon rosae]
MFLLAVWLALGSIISQQQSVVVADKCWRDTTCTGPADAAFPGEWDQYNYAPGSRTVSPVSYYSPNGGAPASFSGEVLLEGNNTQLIFDFGQEVGGIGYFSCSDPLLTKIWYSGAYTLQTNAVPPSTGRHFPILGSGWSNELDLSAGTTGGTVYVDGSKRDRTVWPGDLAIAVPSILVSTGDWEGVANTLQILYNEQTSAGELPFAGPGITTYGSDTYHLITLIASFDYFFWTNDQGWLETTYPKYQRAMTFITGKIDSTGLLSVTGTSDWGRVSQGGHNTAANMLMYQVLTSASQLATWAGDSASSTTWSRQASALKTAVNQLNYDAAAGAFRDNDTDTSLHPQDGNALALLYSVPPSSAMTAISNALTKNWISIGALAPELPGNLVGFGQSFEVKGHFAAQQAGRALDLIRRAWGWYLHSPYGTGSTCLEGYLADGSFGYRSKYGYADDSSYTSHAHGWSTGPTDALTSYVVGLTVTAPGGTEWALGPQFGDLTSAEAGFTTPLGKFRAKWALLQGGYTLAWATPPDTSGVVVLPGSDGKPATSVKMDGEERVIQAQEVNASSGAIIITVSGGSQSVSVAY